MTLFFADAIKDEVLRQTGAQIIATGVGGLVNLKNYFFIKS